MELALAFVLGAVIGSFLNVCIDRLPRGESLLAPPSHCDACGRRLGPLEMVPVVSYLAVRGRCRTCRTLIPRRVLWVEAGTSLLFLLVYLRFGPTLATLLAATFVSWMVVVAAIDLEHRRILNVVTYPAIALALAAVFIPGRVPLAYLLGGLLGGGALLLLALASPRAMGLGDVKLGLFLGLFLGYPLILVALFLAFVIGGLFSLILLALQRLRRGQAVAFGPYLALGGVIALLYGYNLLTWWLARI
jgi:leader peptidase (prepilin peptidase)/N-methyltransferase